MTKVPDIMTLVKAAAEAEFRPMDAGERDAFSGAPENAQICADNPDFLIIRAEMEEGQPATLSFILSVDEYGHEPDPQQVDLRVMVVL